MNGYYFLYYYFIFSTQWEKNTGCPTRSRTRHFFNNSNTNEVIVGVRSLCEK